MDIIVELFYHAINFGVASIPLVLTYLLLKKYKLPIKAIVICLLLNFVVNLFFWLKIKDGYLALYQCIPYASGFTWLWVENKWRKLIKKD